MIKSFGNAIPPRRPEGSRAEIAPGPQLIHYSPPRSPTPRTPGAKPAPPGGCAAPAAPHVWGKAGGARRTHAHGARTRTPGACTRTREGSHATYPAAATGSAEPSRAGQRRAQRRRAGCGCGTLGVVVRSRGGWGGAWPGSPLPSTHPPGPPKEPPCILQGCPLRDARTGWCFPNHESWRWAGRGGDDNAAFTARRGVRPGEMFSALPDLQRNLRKIPGSPPAVTRFLWQA